jgi:hypothetical protein
LKLSVTRSAARVYQYIGYVWISIDEIWAKKPYSIDCREGHNLQGGLSMDKESEFAGKWKIIEAIDMVEDYLSISPDPYLLIQVDEKNEVTGSYQFGTQDGYIDGRFERDNQSLKLVFSFEGWDEADLVNGSGSFCIESEDTYLLTMSYVTGNTFSFRCQATQEDLTTNAGDAA